MGLSDRSFSQVKAILGKLDRSIDQLREQRTGGHEPAAPQVAPNKPAPSLANTPRTAEAAPPTANRPPSPFGRATPLNRGG